MRRRAVIRGLTATSALVLPSTAQAQTPSTRVRRVAYLTGGSLAPRLPYLKGFRAAMQELGYREGVDLLIDSRGAEGRFELLPALAAELIAGGPDVLLVSTTPAVAAAKAATVGTPIVMLAVADPLGMRFVSSLARPGGNITGVTNSAAELTGKRLELLKEMFPAASRLAVLVNYNDPNASLQLQQAEAAAITLGIRLDPVLAIDTAADIESVIAQAARSGAPAALRMVDPLLTVLRPLTQQLAMRYRLPMMYAFREDVEAGGLLSYGANFADQYRQAARFVDRILRGARPSDLPVEQPTRFELVINIKTARLLGLEVPATLLARADEVME